MTRLPIRLRLTIAFTLAMIFVLAFAGWFIYVRLGRNLAQALDQGLRQRGQDLGASVREPAVILNLNGAGLIERGEAFAQVVDDRGIVLESTSLLGNQPLLTPQELARARRGAIFTDRSAVPGLDEPARLLASPVTRGSPRVVLVVGTTKQNRAETLANLRTEMLIGGPVILLATSLGGYLLAGAALRPVEVMRRRAESITAHDTGQRLPVPAAQDELSRLGATLNDLMGRLEAAVTRERNFVADASHELRTPLALLKTQLELALRHPRTAAELRAAIESATEETDRLVQLAESLLVIAGASSAQLPLRKVRMNAAELLDRSTQRFAAEAAAHGRRLRTDVDGAATLVADPTRLEQALCGLLDNALRHGAGEIVARATQHGLSVELHVTDDGPGFPADYLPRAFERFSRPDASRGHGTGLGLCVAQSIAQAHGGNAHAVNRGGGGADVWLVIPQAR